MARRRARATETPVGGGLLEGAERAQRAARASASCQRPVAARERLDRGRLRHPAHPRRRAGAVGEVVLPRQVAVAARAERAQPVEAAGQRAGAAAVLASCGCAARPGRRRRSRSRGPSSRAAGAAGRGPGSTGRSRGRCRGSCASRTAGIGERAQKRALVRRTRNVGRAGRRSACALAASVRTVPDDVAELRAADAGQLAQRRVGVRPVAAQARLQRRRDPPGQPRDAQRRLDRRRAPRARDLRRAAAPRPRAGGAAARSRRRSSAAACRAARRAAPAWPARRRLRRRRRRSPRARRQRARTARRGILPGDRRPARRLQCARIARPSTPEGGGSRVRFGHRGEGEPRCRV